MTIEQSGTVVDPSEIAAGKRILTYFQEFEAWEITLSKYFHVQPGSSLAGDDANMIHYPVSQYAYSQIMGALGVLHALKIMMVVEEDTVTRINAGPFGHYALARNAMDCAGLALWLLEPINSKLRIKRRLRVQMDEIQKSTQFRAEAGLPAHEWAKKYKARMQQVADESGTASGSVSKLKLPSTTQILREVERHHDNEGLSWLAAWQLASGHAHGKQWAILMSNELEELPETGNDVGAVFWNTVSYANLDQVLLASRDLVRAICRRYTELAKS